jgi:hypothetical protein
MEGWILNSSSLSVFHAFNVPQTHVAVALQTSVRPPSPAKTLQPFSPMDVSDETAICQERHKPVLRSSEEVKEARASGHQARMNHQQQLSSCFYFPCFQDTMSRHFFIAPCERLRFQTSHPDGSIL